MIDTWIIGPLRTILFLPCGSFKQLMIQATQEHEKKRGLFRGLAARYRAIPRDYLSDTPLLRAMPCSYGGFGVSTWPIGCGSLPLFWGFPPWGACEVEVRSPPPTKGVSQRRYPMKTRKTRAIPPSVIQSRKGMARYGGISHWASKFRGQWIIWKPLIQAGVNQTDKVRAQGEDCKRLV